MIYKAPSAFACNASCQFGTARAIPGCTQMQTLCVCVCVCVFICVCVCVSRAFDANRTLHFTCLDLRTFRRRFTGSADDTYMLFENCQLRSPVNAQTLMCVPICSHLHRLWGVRIDQLDIFQCPCQVDLHEASRAYLKLRVSMC